MITIPFMGGLGNQLWQYAYGRALSQTQEVQYDISVYGSNSHRQYRLDKLGLNLYLGKGRGLIVNEKSSRFDPSLLEVKGDAVVTGYFQSPAYFESVKHRILAEVFTGIQLSEIAKDYERAIRAESNPVFVHIRRTDYLKEPHASFHGNLELSYYREAMEAMKRQRHDSTFFVFSDDPIWCRLNFNNATIVCGTQDYEDLYLMAQTKHGILANSSFSWWGAWLGVYQKNGALIAPKNWYKNPNIDCSDLVPNEWARL